MTSTRDLALRMLGATPRRAAAPARHVQQLPLPVTVRGRDAPDGVPLEEILAAAKAASSTVEGLVVRGDELTVIHGEQPTADQRDRLDRLLGDQEGLLALDRPAQREPTPAGALRAALLSADTPDADWLRAFRQWAVAELLTRDGEG
jgi:hypothetical protein